MKRLALIGSLLVVGCGGDPFEAAGIDAPFERPDADSAIAQTDAGLDAPDMRPEMRPDARPDANEPPEAAIPDAPITPIEAYICNSTSFQCAGTTTTAPDSFCFLPPTGSSGQPFVAAMPPECAGCALYTCACLLAHNGCPQATITCSGDLASGLVLHCGD